MFLDDINKLQSYNEYPCVSVLMPTHRTFPDNQQDAIRVKNLVKEAKDRLSKDLPKKDAEELSRKIDELAEGIDYEYALNGLVLYVNKEIAEKYYLPFEISERVIIDSSFATRDLVYTYNRSPRYWILSLSEKPTRFFEGFRDILVEREDGDFPIFYKGPGAGEELPDGKGINKSAYRDEMMTQFFREVDHAVTREMRNDALPLALLGIERNIAFFKEVSSNNRLIIAEKSGSYDKESESEIAKLIYPIVKEGLRVKRQEIYGELEKAIGAKKYASGIDEVWHTSAEGRVDTLILEENYHLQAKRNGVSIDFVPVTGDSPDDIEDAVDELIETVLGKDGKVVFVDDGSLEKYGRVTAILRY